MRRDTGSDCKNIWRNFKSFNPLIEVERNWGQAGETAARGAGHGVRVLLCRQMGNKVKQSGGGEKTGQRHIGKDVYVTCQGTRGEFEPRRS